MNLRQQINKMNKDLGIELNLEKTLKKLVDYDSIDALVEALMGHYNTELGEKAESSHNHKKADISDFPTSMKNPNALEIKMNGKNLVLYDGEAAKSINITASGVGAYTKTETDEKFKNFCPIPIGGVLTMWNETNPTSLYLGTTWELISSGKYIQSGTQSLQTGGNNSISITKDNLPNIKLKIDPFSLTIKDSRLYSVKFESANYGNGGIISRDGTLKIFSGANTNPAGSHIFINKEESSISSTVNPLTESLGNGTAINIQPSYITLKFWKRLT